MFDKVEAFYRPDSVREALRLLQSGRGQARVVAGGTDLVVEADDSVRVLIDITRAGLNYIRHKRGGCTIGATATMAELEDSDIIRDLAGGLLANVARTCGSVPIRNLATIGGNMANASPAADMATPLLVLDAAVVIADSRGRRKLPLADYLAGARRSVKSLLVEIVLPDPPCGKGCRWSYQKLGRTAVDISLVSVAAGLQLDSRRRVKWARIALGAMAPTAMRASGAEQRIAGRTLDCALIAEIGEQAAREARPITDVRATAEYRREMCAVLTRRAIQECADHAGQTGCSL
jgi:carbon-monoxide dehydrogenase medium subunit